MSIIRIAPGLEMHYLVDDYTDPWREPETVLLLHGAAESGAVWFGWVPHLARHFHVVRPDMRGFGASTPMPREYAWSIDGLIDDFVALTQTLNIHRFHLVGAKVGGHIARRFAARHPECVRTLTLVGAPSPYGNPTGRRAYGEKVEIISTWLEEFEKQGVESWARRTMSGRLGSRFPPEGVEWWIKLMGRTPVSTQLGFVSTIAGTDVSSDLPRIGCPTLVITAEGSARDPVEKVREWQQRIPHSTLLVLPGDSFHVAASDPDRCAQATLDFILHAVTAAA